MRRGRTAQARVTVLLALCGGTRHLEAQLQSYLAQSLPPVHVLASDDRPGDGTGRMFRRFAASAPGSTRWQLCRGPQRGCAANFLHLLGQVDPESTEFVALSDQDDIWLAAKLESAVRRLEAARPCPALIGSRSWEWNEARNTVTLSRRVPGPLGFSHALVQNFAGGNTMVLNRAALELVQRALPGVPVPAVHDWWLYQLVSGAGGTVLHDGGARILYRQHTANLIGANAGLASSVRRFLWMLGGTYRGWMDRNIAALEACSGLLTQDARRILAQAAKGRDGPLLRRLAMLRETGLHRKGGLNQAALWLAAALHRL